MNPIDNQTSRQKTVIGIFFSLFLLCAYFLFTPLLKNTPLSKETLFLISRALIWVCVLLLYIYARQFEKQKFLLWEEREYDLLFYIKSYLGITLSIIGGLLIIGMLIALSGSNVESKRLLEIVQLLKHNTFLLVFTCFTAGVTEELIFRGYLLPRLALFFKKSYVTIGISSVLFGLLHFSYGTIIQIIAPIFIGAVFAVHYYKYRNIKIIILCHFLWDLIQLLIKTV